MIRESSRLTGINFCSFKCLSECMSLFSALFVDGVRTQREPASHARHASHKCEPCEP